MIQRVQVQAGGPARAPADGFALYPAPDGPPVKHRVGSMVLLLPGGQDGVFAVSKGAFLMEYVSFKGDPPRLIPILESEYGPVLEAFNGTIFFATVGFPQRRMMQVYDCPHCHHPIDLAGWSPYTSQVRETACPSCNQVADIEWDDDGGGWRAWLTPRCSPTSPETT